MYRLLNAACQICAYSLDLQGYSKEFMYGTSWAVSHVPFYQGLTSYLIFLKFVSAGPIFVLPIIKYWLKDTNMVQSVEAIEGSEISETKVAAEVPETKKTADVAQQPS